MAKSKPSVGGTDAFQSIYKAIASQIEEEEVGSITAKSKAISRNYRNAALKHYTRHIEGVQLHVCVMCGFGIKAILEVAHLSQDRSDNSIENLAILCPNCHKMHDIGLIPSSVIKEMRDLKPSLDWKLRIKDAGLKAAATRRSKAAKDARSASAKKAVATRSTRLAAIKE